MDRTRDGRSRRSKEELRRILFRIDQKGYGAYKEIEGVYDFGSFVLCIDHVQGDPFASPSRVRVVVPAREAGFPAALYTSSSRRIGLQDYLTRAFAVAIRQVAKGDRGMGKSGLIQIDGCGQEVLERTAMRIDAAGNVEARFVMGLPARGRTILGQQAEAMFFEEVPAIVSRALCYRNLPRQSVQQHVEAVEDQDHLRAHLRERGLVAFLGNGAILPRRSGVDDRPLVGGRGTVVVPFHSPPSLAVTLNVPNAGPITGMGIPEGITLIVGGGFHGKSTLLRAIERGVYNHIPGDGREWVVTIPEAVKIRAEDGRRIEKVNISPFIQSLPFGKDTTSFSTDNASGSTSQAANIMEALEMGSRLLLIDEDTSATNFMIRDRRMQRLVQKEKEPITPFLDKVKQIYQDLGVSTILVMGGSGDYFDVADYVLMMDSYEARDVTEQARAVMAEFPSQRQPEGGAHFGEISPRVPAAESFDSRRGRREVKIDAKGLHTIVYGTTTIDLSYLEQLVDPSQTRAIGASIYYACTRYMDGKRSLPEILRQVMADIDQAGLDVLTPIKVGNLARPRPFEIAGAINRMRTLRIR
ncbi:MAG: ATPase [Nitrospinota bacterium]|nr:MAG: ATPase [Nitrospinota bacterium]